MAIGPGRRFNLRTDTMTRPQAEAAQIDVGLRQYMLRVYNYMALGVALTGVIAMVVAMNPAVMQAIVGGPFVWVLFIGILGMGFVAPRIMMSKSVVAAQACFWVYAAMWGALIAPYFYIYTQESIARVFFITAGAFAATSLYGYTTKRDLTAMGRFLTMATFGILIAIVVNLFLQSTGLHLLMSIVVPLIFAGSHRLRDPADQGLVLRGRPGRRDPPQGHLRRVPAVRQLRDHVRVADATVRRRPQLAAGPA